MRQLSFGLPLYLYIFRIVVVVTKKIKLTNRFHVVVRLFSNRSQMTSKCGENKKVAHEAIAECVTDVLMFSKSKAGLCPLWRTRKKAIWRKLLSIQNAAISLVAMRSKESWLVQGYHATVKLDSKVASPVMKTYSESRTELQNLQILKKILEKSSQFLPSEQPCEPKSLDVALKIAASEKIRS